MNLVEVLSYLFFFSGRLTVSPLSKRLEYVHCSSFQMAHGREIWRGTLQLKKGEKWKVRYQHSLHRQLYVLFLFSTCCSNRVISISLPTFEVVLLRI